MEQRGYESEESAGEIWVRYRPRRTAFPEVYARVLAVLSQAVADDSVLDWVSSVDRSYDDAHPKARIATCREVVQAAADAPDFKFLYRLNLCLCVCPGASRRAFLRRDFLPAFFRRFPAGRIVFIGTDSRAEDLIPNLRVGNFVQVNGANAIHDLESKPQVAIGTARALHQTGLVSLREALAAVLGNFMPLRTHFVGGRPGLMAVYLFGSPSPQAIDIGPFPRTEADIYAAQNFMVGDEPDITMFQDPTQAWLGRFRNTAYPGDEQMILLLQFLLRRINEHIANRLEVCNFADNDNVDFIEAFEKYLTIERIFRECVLIATTTNSAMARLLSFAVIDKFHELCRFAGVDHRRNFHHMCSRPFLNAVLLPAFHQLPSPWDDFFRVKAVDLYDDLYSTIRSARGVWANQLVQATGGVNVYRAWDRATGQFVSVPTAQSDDEFVAEYVRAARNTHHGYLSDGDNRRRFATYGSISTAFLPDSFTQLPLLLLLAEVLAPRLMSGYHWLDQSSLELAV